MVIAIKFIKLARVFSTLLQSELISNGAHDIPVPVDESNPVGESVVDVVNAVPIHTREVKIPDKKLRDNAIECTPSIQKEKICTPLKSIDRMLGDFCHK